MAAKQIITPSLLNTIRSHPHLPPQTWYFLTSVTLSALNLPHEIPTVLQHALSKAPQDTGPAATPENLQTARRLRESLVKSSAVLGLPKTINALLALKAATPPPLQDAPLAYSPSRRALDLASTPSSTILQRGERLFDTIYGKISARVMGQMDNSGTEDLGLAARVAYGYILSGGEGILSARETSFVVLAALVPQDVNPQLKGHLKGAVNNGASVEEVRAVRGVVISVCEAAGMTRLEGHGAGWGWTQEVANL